VINFSGRGILLDIEGTTSSISFVYDVMFPFARRELETYLDEQFQSQEMLQARETIARDIGFASFDEWSDGSTDERQQKQLVRDEIVRLMDGDVKATGLKQVQGYIWRTGFHSGELKSHVYDDVPPAIRSWSAAGQDIRIYSSGSVGAQMLFFGHTIHGDLLPLFGGHYDTTTGAKQEPASYVKIAGEFAFAPAEILFISDVADELDAAISAGMRTALCVRPTDGAPAQNSQHPEITDFSQINLFDC